MVELNTPTNLAVVAVWGGVTEWEQPSLESVLLKVRPDVVNTG